MYGEQTRRAIAAQPEWLAQVPTDRRFPDGARLLFTGCGTSFHAAMTGGEAVQALELVLRLQGAEGARSFRPGVAGSAGGASSLERAADLLVLVSHEGETPLTLEAARAWRGPRWLVTGRADGPIAELCDEVVVCTPEIEESWCHTASYTCAVAAIAALRGEDISWLPGAVEEALAAPLPEVGDEERFLVAGAGRELADRPRGGAQAARRRLGRGRGVRDRAAPPRLSRRGRRVGARLRARRRRRRRGAGGCSGRRAARARLRASTSCRRVTRSSTSCASSA